MTTVEDIQILNFKCFSEVDGNLVPLEFDKDIPFDIKRAFYVYGVTNHQTRGEHAHYNTKQVLICLSGECVIICKDSKSEKKFMLDSPTKGLYIPEMIWDEVIYKSSGAVLLAFTNTLYDAADYIEEYDEFIKLRESV